MTAQSELKRQIIELKRTRKETASRTWTTCDETYSNINRKVDAYNKNKKFWQRSLTKV